MWYKTAKLFYEDFDSQFSFIDLFHFFSENEGDEDDVINVKPVFEGCYGES